MKQIISITEGGCGHCGDSEILALAHKYNNPSAYTDTDLDKGSKIAVAIAEKGILPPYTFHLCTDPRRVEGCDVVTYRLMVTYKDKGYQENILKGMPLYKIAQIIQSEWGNSPRGIWYGARPYLNAMGQLHSIDDHAGYESARMVVNYFLVNAHKWTGPVARCVKKELRRRVK